MKQFILLYVPYKAVKESGMLPKNLLFIDPVSKKKTISAPHIVGDNIFYGVCEEYANALLTDKRFKLVSPKSTVIMAMNKVTMGIEAIDVKAVKVPEIPEELLTDDNDKDKEIAALKAQIASGTDKDKEIAALKAQAAGGEGAGAKTPASGKGKTSI